MTQKYAFVVSLTSEYPVTVLCRVLGLTRSGYYAWRTRRPSAHAQRDAELTAQIRTIFAASHQTYGSPRVHAELREHSIYCGRKRVARLMRQSELVARPRRRCVRTTDSCHSEPVAPNRLSRVFTTEAPNRVWVADITYLPTREGWLYLAVVLDLFARRVVGWSMQAHMERSLVIAALQHALQRRRPPSGLVHHSDRGSQYASAEYQTVLSQAGITCSMSRRGNCWDNAVIESFFATRKAEIAQETFVSRQAARSSVFDYIERFYNRKRRHSTLGFVSPAVYERDWFAHSTGVILPCP